VTQAPVNSFGRCLLALPAQDEKHLVQLQLSNHLRRFTLKNWPTPAWINATPFQLADI